MKPDPLVRSVLATWKRHNQILLFLLTRVPEKALGSVPMGSKGRDVARQFAHVERVRQGWLRFHETGERPELPKAPKDQRPAKKELKAALQVSGKAIEEHLAKALRGEARVRLFGRSPVRFLGYLIAHESHHRGQILLALKQSGFPIKEDVVMKGLWGKWMFGK